MTRNRVKDDRYETTRHAWVWSRRFRAFASWLGFARTGLFMLMLAMPLLVQAGERGMNTGERTAEKVDWPFEIINHGPYLLGPEHMLLYRVSYQQVAGQSLQLVLLANGEQASGAKPMDQRKSPAVGGQKVVARALLRPGLPGFYQAIIPSPPKPGIYAVRIAIQQAGWSAMPVKSLYQTNIRFATQVAPRVVMPRMARPGSEIPVVVFGTRTPDNMVELQAPNGQITRYRLDQLQAFEGEQMVLPQQTGHYQIRFHYRQKDGTMTVRPLGRMIIQADAPEMQDGHLQVFGIRPERLLPEAIPN